VGPPVIFAIRKATFPGHFSSSALDAIRLLLPPEPQELSKTLRDSRDVVLWENNYTELIRKRFGIWTGNGRRGKHRIPSKRRENMDRPGGFSSYLSAKI
jgi:hypothetical protein